VEFRSRSKVTIFEQLESRVQVSSAQLLKDEGLFPREKLDLKDRQTNLSSKAGLSHTFLLVGPCKFFPEICAELARCHGKLHQLRSENAPRSPPAEFGAQVIS